MNTMRNCFAGLALVALAVNLLSALVLVCCFMGVPGIRCPPW